MGAVGGAELAKDVAQVDLHRGLAIASSWAISLFGRPVGQAAEHLELLGCEQLGRELRATGGCRLARSGGRRGARQWASRSRPSAPAGCPAPARRGRPQWRRKPRALCGGSGHIGIGIVIAQHDQRRLRERSPDALHRPSGPHRHEAQIDMLARGHGLELAPADRSQPHRRPFRSHPTGQHRASAAVHRATAPSPRPRRVVPAAPAADRRGLARCPVRRRCAWR